MTAFTAARPSAAADLPPDARGPVRCEYTPSVAAGVGVLVVYQKRLTSTYVVVERPGRAGGRAFALTKLGGGSDRDSESYEVLVGDRPDRHDCPCKGFQRWRSRRLCKHLGGLIETVIPVEDGRCATRN